MTRFNTSIAALSLVLWLGSAAWAQSSSVCDLNGSHSVDVRDLQAAINVNLGAGDCPSARGCDVNLDGVQDDADIEAIIDELLGGTACANTAFRSSTTFNIMPHPIAVAAQSLDGTGNPDLLVASIHNNVTNPAGDSISLGINSGGGDFAIQDAVVSFETPCLPTAIALGDLDGTDGVDFATTCIGSEELGLQVFGADGHGGFRLLDTMRVGQAVKVIAAELDGNPGMDLAIVRRSEPAQLIVARANAPGDWPEEGTVYELGGPENSYLRAQDVAAADCNNDGHLDLAVAIFGRSGGSPHDTLVWVLTNDGSGDFRAGPEVRGGPNPIAVRFADFNNDGWPDLAFANHDRDNTSSGPDTVTVALNDQSCGFPHPVEIPINAPGSPDAHPTDLVVADLNNDRNLDIIVANAASVFRDVGIAQGWVTLFLGDGQGGFVAEAELPAPSCVTPLINAPCHPTRCNTENCSESGSPNNGCYAPIAVVAQDIDGNGWTDVAFINSQRANDACDLLGRLSVWLQ